MPLTAEVTEAVVHGRGQLGAVLTEVRTYQRDAPVAVVPDLAEDMLSALRWTNASLSEPDAEDTAARRG
ncbi:hypothetical protein [Dactylosporangium cerinum]